MKKKLISAIVLLTVILGCSMVAMIPEETDKAAEIENIETTTESEEFAEPSIEEPEKIIYTSSTAETEATETETETTEVTETEEPLGEDTYICEEYQEYIYEISEMYGVCPELIMAIIEAESSGRAKAYNSKYGCTGLMQINPSANKDRIERLGVTDLYDPYQNILVGVDLITWLADRCDGDIYWVLMRYHGESNAKQKAESGNYSKYAMKIVARAEELERVHGK